MAASGRLVSVDYEVFGKVQGVFFRKNTKRTADKLGLVGWVKNEVKPRPGQAVLKTVVGQVQGEESKVFVMKKWLRETGSPKSKIKDAHFRNESIIDRLEFSSFDIRK
ncbi:acylphosphatase-2-like [Branchiostoma lanceolatum]|uniref:acylphosphatase-2-like n=1 Tax=Branchiostoma lanceolatum TaxID=7740 RepID=UPI003455FB38